jgi:DNA mismatch endonuclease (patch repair protein)
MDVFSRDQRSDIMRKVRSKDTTPEKLVRSLLHNCGYQVSLSNKNLPGNPDIVLSRHKTVIFVHGCFWHRHKGCSAASMPQSNIDYWRKKFSGNVKRDRLAKRELRQLGWRVCVIWECQTKFPQKLTARLKRLLNPACYYENHVDNLTCKAAEDSPVYESEKKG